jgi:anaerobic selenocysteine-containing dehydrogenase
MSIKTIRCVCPHDCPDTCGLVVTVEDGRATMLRGDRAHPFTKGFLCMKVSRYLERVYHKDRLQFPLKRVGPKGTGQFERITWEEALEIVARRFKEIAASPDGPQAILPYSYAGTMGKLQGSSLDRRFFHRLGASLLDRTICATAGAAGCEYTLGTRAALDPEAVIHSRYIINWGSNTRVTNMHLWAIMHQARKQGAKIVTIDPYRSKTAEHSDWWIPIRPGTDAALALGIMHILWRDGLQDDDYLNRHCLGVDLLRKRALKDYPPERVSAITSIPTADVARLATEYGRTRPALIRLNYGLQRHAGGGMAVRTITCLPSLTGDWRQVGGGALLSTSKLYPFNTAGLERPDLIPPGTRTINMVQLAEALHGELPGPPVRALYVYNSNPAAVCPDQQRVLAGLLREDLFTVVHEQFPTDTCDYADIVLPATMQLEHFDIHGSYGHLYVQTNEPAIAPLGEAKSNNDVFRLLARKMGFEPELFETSDRELAAEALEVNGHGKPSEDVGWVESSRPDVGGLPVGEPGREDSAHRSPAVVGRSVAAASGREGAMSPQPRRFDPPYPVPGGSAAFAGITLARLEREGPVRLNYPQAYAPFAEGRFPTPSGKCEFYSERLLRMGLDPLPTYTPPAEDPQTQPELARRRPLQMVSPPHPSFLNSTFVNIDSLRAAEREPGLEIHPDDAKARGIKNGELVEVVNDRGRFQARAIVGETVKPGVVVTQGIWWNKFTNDRVNCNSTTSTRLTDLGAGATFFDNLVEVRRCQS